MQQWQKLRTLGWLDWQVILFSLVALPWCAVSLRLRGFQKTRAAFYASELAAGEYAATLDQLDRARRVARAVDLAALYGPYRANCLKRSLVLCRQLHKRKLPGQLRLGASRPGGEFSAHAWVEVGGNVINDQPEIPARFAVLDTHGRKGR